jgi:hypothetical protein
MGFLGSFTTSVFVAPQTAARLSEPSVTMGVLPREALRMLRSLVAATRSATTLDTPQLRKTLWLCYVTVSIEVFFSLQKRYYLWR